jgi:ribosome-binding factor A
VGRRQLRVNEALRETLSAALSDIKDPRVGFVTITGVAVSPDLRHARVYVSVLGSARERERSLDGLRSSQGFLQERVASELRLKRTPQLGFFYDESIDRGQYIEKLLRRAAEESAPVEADDAGVPDAEEEGR